MQFKEVTAVFAKAAESLAGHYVITGLKPLLELFRKREGEINFSVDDTESFSVVTPFCRRFLLRTGSR